MGDNWNGRRIMMKIEDLKKGMTILAREYADNSLREVYIGGIIEEDITEEAIEAQYTWMTKERFEEKYEVLKIISAPNSKDDYYYDKVWELAQQLYLQGKDSARSIGMATLLVDAFYQFKKETEECQD